MRRAEAIKSDIQQQQEVCMHTLFARTCIAKYIQAMIDAQGAQHSMP